MRLIGTGQQGRQDQLYSSDGAIATGGTPQLVLAQSISRSHLILQNLSATVIVFEIGPARARATITNGQVTGVTITNAGFNYTKPPIVRFLGGGNNGNSSYLGLNQPAGPNPQNSAIGHAVLTSGAVSSIVIDNPGSGYVIAPWVLLQNSDLDPYGCAVPSATSGIALAQDQIHVWNGTVCPTDAVAVWGATAAQGFTCRWMD